MPQDIDFSVAELLSSRLCHELVGSAGAVGNGIELIKDTVLDGGGAHEDGMRDEALALVDQSAQQVINKLKFYRMAYGFAGRSSANLAELRSLAQAFVGDDRIRISWPLPPILPELREGDGKLILNMVVIAVEGLPRGGEIHVDLADTGLSVILTGEGCMIHEDLLRSMDLGIPAEELSPRGVHGYWTSILAENAGRKLAVEQNGEGEIAVLAA